MSNLKLFRLSSGGVAELPGSAIQVEKSLQTLFENNLEPMLGVRFLASEHSTGKVHGGRIDTLGIDEDGSPVIIEYKRAVNENVINQGLYYLSWLRDHRGDFELLVQKKLGAAVADKIDWSGPRLLCIAGDFTRYDEHAVNEISHNIELLRYRRFADDLLVIELVHAPKKESAAPLLGPAKPKTPAPTGTGKDSDPYATKLIAYRIAQAHGALRDLLEAVLQYLEALGDDVQVKEQKYYIAFKRIKNFACLEINPVKKIVEVYLKINPKSLVLEENFTRDVTDIGHWGTGDLQVSLRSMADFERAKPLFERSYQGS